MTSASAQERPLTASSRVRARWWWLAAVGALVVAAAWWTTHPAPLPRAGSLTAEAPVGSTVTLGVLAVDREVELRSVRWDVALGGGDVQARVCRGGSVSATRDLAPFCDDVVPAEGATLRPGDQLVLEVSAAEPGRRSLAGVQVEFRDGLQWGSQRAGRDLEVVVTDR